MADIADKIQKLLALAGNNPNEAEAEAALLKAQELMAQYNVDMDGLQTGATIKHELVMTKVKAHSLNNTLSVIIGHSFACRPIIVGKLGFFGREDNAKAAASAMEFAYIVMHKGQRRIAKEMGVYHKAGQAYYQNSYAKGFLAGLKSSLDAQTVALAVVVPQDVHDAFNERFAGAKNYRSKGVIRGDDPEAFAAGTRDGSTVMDKRSLGA
jgi:hypothetical protein